MSKEKNQKKGGGFRPFWFYRLAGFRPLALADGLAPVNHPPASNSKRRAMPFLLQAALNFEITFARYELTQNFLGVWFFPCYHVME